MRDFLLGTFRLGITGKTLGWIQAFLGERRQCVSVNGVHSEWAEVLSGVPQGTVLGPTLFLLYINDIVDDIDSDMRLFADDSILYREINTPEDHKILHHDLERLFHWAAKWQMDFNISKCYLLRITKKRKPSPYTYIIGNRELTQVDSQKYLGITISSDLSWNKQCSQVSSKAHRTLGLLKRTLSDCSKQVKERAYLALVRPQVEYATAAWNPHTDKNVTQLEKVQRQAARFVSGDYRRTTSVTGILTHLGWDTLETRRLLAQTTCFFKIHNQLINIHLPPILQKPSRSCRLSHPLQYLQLQPNNMIFQYSFFVRVIPVWNLLPAQAVTAPDIASFQAAALPVLRTLQPPPGLGLRRY